MSFCSTDSSIPPAAVLPTSSLQEATRQLMSSTLPASSSSFSPESKKRTTKSGQEVGKEEVMRVDPPVVCFEGVEEGVRYVMNISVCNKTNCAHRIRFLPPSSGSFAVNYIPSGAVAPGLDVRAEVECQVEGSEVFVPDYITVVMGPHKKVIPLLARKPCADVVFDPLLNFGLLPEKQVAASSVVFENRGQVAAHVIFKKEHDSKLTLDATSAKIEPKEKFTLNVKCDCKSLGLIRELVRVDVPGVAENMILDVSAQVVQHTLSLLSAQDKSLLEHVEFGAMFYGQSKSVEAILVNNGPQQVNFTITFPDEDSEGGGPEKYISISPMDGTLNPFTQLPVTVKFNPLAPAPGKGFSSQYIGELSEASQIMTKAIVDAHDMNDDQKVHLVLSASIVMPTFKLSPSVLRFGTCPVHDRRDILVELQNTSPSAFKFSFTKGAQYSFTPLAGSVEPNESKSIVASFLPTQLGDTKKVSKLMIEDGLRSAEVRIIGEAVASKLKKRVVGGTSRLPSDFKPSYKFVDPAEVKEKAALRSSGLEGADDKFQREAPWESQEFVSSTSWDEVYESTSQSVNTGPPLSINNDPVTYSLQELQRRAQHKNKYNEYLRSCHSKRAEREAAAQKKMMTTRGRSDRSDPSGVDMGMERGLDEDPRLKVPIADEPLWLANRGEKGERPNMQFDEDRLIGKKAKEGPTTQAEIRECSAELTTESIRKISASHKIINFGKVCVNSINLKNFAVTNELGQMVQIKLGSFENELRQSKPKSQVLAANSTVGFDIQFTCHEICKYKKSFAWTINDKHAYKVTVVAEVVPIEVVLDKQQLTMEFSPESLEKTHTENIVMTNPGNAVAEYAWGNKAHFRCLPEQGSLLPGKSMVVAVTWTPSPIPSDNTEHIGLIVVGGTEQSLAVTGVLSDAKIAFEDKKVSIGAIAVGGEKTVTTKLKNYGSSAAVFHIADIPPNLNIDVRPGRAKLQPGESLDISICLAPKNRVNYDNRTIQSLTRGGKSSYIKLAGEAIFPKLAVLQDRFDFGHVVTGSSQELQFSLVNSGSIDAVAFLNLNSCSDFRPSMTSGDNFDSSILSGAISEDAEGNLLERVKHDEGDHFWKFVIKAGSTFHCYLTFTPQSAHLWDFKFPLTLQGLSPDESLAKTVTAQGLLSRLTVSSHIIDFGDKVVSRDPAARMSYYQEVTFKNVDMSKGLSYEVVDVERIETKKSGGAKKPKREPSEIDQPEFFVSPVQNDLAPGESSTMRVTFLPKSNGDFSKLLHIYVSDQPDKDRPYFTLVCRGSGVYPRLEFSKYKLTLPPVPLNVTSRACCQIYNMGYDNIELKFRVSPTIPVPLSIQFPESNELGLTRDKCLLVVGAKSEKPTSWSGKIEFYDSDGEKFSIEVAGCADCSMLTAYPFVRDYSDRYGFLGLDDQPVRFCAKKEIAVLKANEVKMKSMNRKKSKQNTSNETTGQDEVNSTIKQVSIEDGDEGVEISREEVSSDRNADVKFLLKWLNCFICRKPFDVDNFVDNIIQTNGDVVVDCLEQLSGKKVSSLIASSNQPRIPGESDQNQKNADSNANVDSMMAGRINNVSKLLLKYRNLLNFLTKYGGLVLHISPQSLLDFESYLLAQELELKKVEGIRLTQAMLKERRKLWEADWREACSDAWSQVLFQSYKVFVLCRVTYTDYINTPGVVITSARDAKPDKSSKGDGKKKKKERGPKAPPELQASNIFSQSESIVLAWVAYHQLKAGRLSDTKPSDSPGSASTARMPSMNRRITDIGAEFSDFFSFCQIVHSHLPDFTAEGKALAGYTFTEQSDFERNFTRFKRSLSELRMDFEVSMEELTTSARAMTIMVFHLFLNMPNLIPKTTIEFKGALGAPSVKTVELKNPSSKSVSYDVTVDGPSDFSIDAHYVTLEPKSITGFLVKCNPRFSKVTQGRLNFWGIRENGVGGSNIVFDLVSKVTDRLPVSTIKRNVCMYDSERIDIEVKNPFGKDCTFGVSIVQHFVPTTAQHLIGDHTKQNKTSAPVSRSSISGTNQAMAALMNEVSGGAAVKEEEEDENLFIFKNAFWCNDTTVTLAANESKKITVHALPFMLGVFTCQLVLVEEKTGECCYEVIMNVGLPSPVEELSFESAQLDKGNSIQKVLKVASANSPFEKAIIVATDARLPLNKRAKARASLQSMLQSAIYSEDTGQSQFAVHFNSPFFSSSKEFGLVTSVGGSSTGGGISSRAGTGAPSKRYSKNAKNSLDSFSPSDNQLNSVQFTFFPDKPGVYVSQVVLFSLSNQNDVRVLTIRGTINPSQSGMTIKFKGTARRKVTQDIPLHNESEKDWQLQANIVGPAFSAPKVIAVPSLSTVAFPVSFVSQSSGEFQGSLHLKNPAVMQDSFEFKLKGVAEDPLAEDNLYFKCKARSTEELVIRLPGVSSPKTYSVETDLNYLIGDDEVYISETGALYRFSVNCPVGGVLSGSITFKDLTTDNIIWYTISVEITSPVAESTIDVESEVRKAASVEISLDNPTDETLEFQVVTNGDGLLGDSTYVLAPNSSHQEPYELIYSPLSVGKFTGSIVFQNDTVGEFWHKLNLVAHPALPVVVNTIECMIGSSKGTLVPIENPLPESVVLTARSFDTRHFSVGTDTIALGPYSQDHFEVRFCPSSLNEHVSTEIIVSHPSLGDIVYEVSGKGLLPGIMPTINISAPLKEIGSHTVLFRNNFLHPLPIDIILYEDENQSAAFELLVRKSQGLVLAPETILQVPVSFSPEKLCDYHATLEFRSSVGGHNFRWCYPICGLAEVGVAHKLPKLSTACKSSLLREVDIPLTGLQAEGLVESDFSVEIATPDPKQRALVTRAFRIQPLSLIEVHVSDFSHAFRCRLLFEPLRVFSADVEIILSCKNKGRWRAEVELDALDPPFDDSIMLTAPVGGTDHVSFKLSNRFLGYSPFEAYFSARSSPHFTVSPSSGVLAPFGSAEGTKFVVTFSPKEYGIREKATLVVTTEEAQWNYEILGSYPDVSIKTSQIKSKIDAGRR